MPLERVAIIVTLISAALIASFFLFRAARHPACTWPRHWRYAAQAPGWLLAAAGAWVLTIYGIQQLSRGEIGLGAGFVIAMLFATIKGVSVAVGQYRQR